MRPRWALNPQKQPTAGRMYVFPAACFVQTRWRRHNRPIRPSRRLPAATLRTSDARIPQPAQLACLSRVQGRPTAKEHRDTTLLRRRGPLLRDPQPDREPEASRDEHALPPPVTEPAEDEKQEQNDDQYPSPGWLGVTSGPEHSPTTHPLKRNPRRVFTFRPPGITGAVVAATHDSRGNSGPVRPRRPERATGLSACRKTALAD